jgi:predicted nucleic acid-binding protein
VAAGLTLDSGALIAAEKGDRRFWTIWSEAMERGATVTVPAAVVAEVWRATSVVVARVLNGCDVEPLTEERAKAIGRLLALSRTSDVVDAAVVIGATARHDAIVTSDKGDIDRLVRATRRRMVVLEI